jgi:septal ring factor EnvC (AmiA/AmiB activator)
MFDDKFFDDWLDSQAQLVMNKVANGEGIAPEQMMILMLKAQTNHFAHLDVELRNEMITLREDMDKRFEQVDKRFEQVDKRFEQVDKRFEQVDKRFEQLTSRIDHFMIWSFATTVSVGGMIVAAIKFL